ncbi:MAG: hypothetical protein IT426_16065 [Pirellulales bacterium]|nr:hypothetical protein [Pirellulales bacterium]
MEARILRAAFVAVVLLVSLGAKYRSANYIVETADPRLAQQFAEAAESYRQTLAVSWLGKELPKWSRPCPVKVLVGPNLGAGGATTFTFDRGEVFGWTMSIQGSRERVLDSVLPHEITHMIFASHFRRPLPRWADEGGATSVEHYTERNKQRALLDQYLRTGRGIAFNKMFAMTEYPADVLPLYAQGYSTAEYLIQSGGRRNYIAFLDDGLKKGDWAGALQRNYNLQNLGELQKTWLAWVKRGSPLKSHSAAPEMLAAAERPAPLDPNAALRARGNAPPSPMPTPLAKATGAPGNSEIILASNDAPGGYRNVLPVTPLAPVSDKHDPAATAATGDANAPYTPGSTIAVSRLSIPSTGWRAAHAAPTSTPSPPNAAADPYRAQVGRPQPLEGPSQTTIWR